MLARKGVSLAVAILIVSACAWAQGRRGGTSGFHAPSAGRQIIRGGGSIHIRRGAPLRWDFGGRGYGFPGFGQPFYRGYGYRPGWNYGYSPYSYFGFGNYANPFSMPYYGSQYGCDPRFSSPPFYCQPLYPQGPPAYGSTGEGPGYENPWNGANRYDPGQPLEAPQPFGGPLGTSTATQRSARDVQLTYDGHALDAGGVLAVTSGKHELVIGARPKK
jgi:hypothetical protein